MPIEISNAEAVVAKPANDVRAGVLWMLATGLLFTAMTATVRYLGSDLPAPVAAFIRYGLGLLMVAPAVVAAFGAHIPRKTWVLFGWRGAAHTVAVLLWFYAMARIPVAEVTALGYTSPIFVTIGAALFLGEKLRMRRIVAIVIALVGVLIILRPGFQEIGMGQLAQVVAAPIFAASFLFAKQLTNTAPSAQIVAMLSLSCTLMLAPFAIATWRTPTLEEMAWLTCTAALATAGHYCLTRAYKAAPITVTQPVTFLQIVWAAALGWFAFSEALDIWVVIGAGVIVTSATYIARREMIAARAGK
jgi:drug/metabolite transporter (DMT)-like permease